MLSNLSPVKKLILGLAAMCIAVSIVTANNLSSIMMLIAARNNANNTATVQQSGTVQNNTQQGTQGGSSTGNQQSTNTSTDTNTNTNTDSGSSTGSDANANSSTGADANTNTDADKPADSGASQGGEKSVAECVEIFNKAANGVKTDAKSVKQNYVTNYLAGTPTITSGISFIYNNLLGGDEWLDGMLKDNSQGEATYTGADVAAKFPVEGESWSSKLTADDVKSATCTEANGVYTITITTKADAKSDNVKRGEGHAPKAFNVVLPGIVNDNIPSAATSLVGTASMDYPESTVVATVDAKTGKLLKAEYDTKWTINFDEMGIILPLGTKASYEVTY